MKKSIDVVVCGPDQQQLWDSYVEGSYTTTLCHQFRWQRVISYTYGHRPFYLIAHMNGSVCGVLPLVFVRSHLFGKSLTSMPFLDYGGICSDSASVAHDLLQYALDLLGTLHADYIELRQLDAAYPSCATRLDKVTMILDLSPGIEDLWRSLPAKVRNQVRKAEKSGLRVSVGGIELLEEFYSVFSANMRDLGSPVHHRAFFSHIFAEFGPQARLMLVCDGERPVGGLVCLFFKDVAVVPWASALREYFPKCPNNLLYWRTIQYAYEHGYRRFDFGRSSVGSGTYNFKSQWGAKPIQLYWQVFGKNGHHAQAPSASNPKYQALVETWKCLPLSLSKWLGPQIRKYLTN